MTFEPFLEALQARLVERVPCVDGRVYRSQHQGTQTMPALWLWVEGASGQGGEWTVTATVHAEVRTSDLRSGESADTRLCAVADEVTEALRRQTGEKPAPEPEATTLGGACRYCLVRGQMVFDQGEAAGMGVVQIPVEALITR